MVVSWRHRQHITRCFGAKITSFVIFAMALVISEARSAPPLTAAMQSALDQVVDDTPMPDASFAVLSPSVIEWFRTSQPSSHDDSLPEVVVTQLLQDPSASRGQLHRIEGLLQERRRMRSPHDGMEEWFIRLSGGEPLVIYAPADQAAIEPGRQVRVDARFYKVLRARAIDGQTRRYPVFLGGHVSPRAPVAGDQRSWRRMDILMLLGFMVLLVLVLVAVMLLARRQLPSERRKVVPMVDRNGDLPDDPAAALRELRSQAGGEQT